MQVKSRIGIALCAVALAALTACGGTSGSGGGYYGSGESSGSSTASTSGSVHTATTKLGTIVVDGAGMTVYFYDHDKPNESASACTGSCIVLWPAVTTTAATPSLAGVTGTIGTITGTDGAKQLTLNGLPLYTFAGDKNPGDTTGQGYGGIWWVVDSAGAKVTGAGPVSSAPSNGGSGY
ncbi:COG4315 family predicted lipoprotein [Arthrobacter psychrolactophilus]